MGKIAIFIDHDIMVRHFVVNRVLSDLEKEHDLLYVFPEKHRRISVDLKNLPIKRFRTVSVSETRLYRYRRLYHATVLKRMRPSQDRASIFDFWRRMLGFRGFWESWFYSWPGTYEWYKKRMLAKIGDNPALHDLLIEEQPDVIIHPTVLEGLFVSDLIRWGKAHGVPTVYLMNSWDNPVTKAITVDAPDRLVVWGEHSRQLAHDRLGIPIDQIVSLGAAQFDGYRLSPRESAPEYRRRLGVPDHWKVLLYAGSSKGLNETYHLIQLEEAIERGQLKNCVVLYRPHPWRDYPKDEADFFSLKWKHVMFEPSMEACYRQSRQKERIHIELANYEDTHITLSAVDVVISPLSTILLEAAMHGKPVAVYLPDEDMTSNTFLFTVANLAHFRDFFEQVECIMCERPEDLIKDCEQLLRLRDDPGISERLQKQCAYFVEPSDRPYADQLSSLIRSLLSPPPSRPPIQKA